MLGKENYKFDSSSTVCLIRWWGSHESYQETEIQSSYWPAH